MKKLVVFLIVAVIANAVFAEDPVYFADENLKEAVEEALGIIDPNATDMLGFITLNAGDRGIVNLDGIQYAVNLRNLYLHFNNISDISALSGLSSLTNLSLASSNINDISDLSGLTNLRGLYLHHNNINDISALKDLNSLNNLFLHDNNISNISALSELAKLTSLALQYNPLNQSAYCIYLPLIRDNNPGINLTYDFGECVLDRFNTRLDGTWYLRNLSTQKNGQPDNFGYEIGVFNFQSDSSFTGTITDDGGSSWNENGISLLAEDGSINLLFSNGNTVLNEAVNISRDIMIGNYQDTDSLGLNVFVKKGEFYSLSDVVGIWYWRGIGTQKNGQPDKFCYDTGVYDFQSDGSFTGVMTDQDGNSWNEGGTFSSDPNGIVTLDFGGDYMYFVLNANKDFMASNSQDVDNLFLDVLVKKGTSYTNSDLAGTWYDYNLCTQKNNQSDNFSYETAIIKIQNDDTFLRIETANTREGSGGKLGYATGTIVVDPNGVLTVDIDGGGFQEYFAVLGASKNVIINNYQTNQIGFEIMLKKQSLYGDLNFDGVVDWRDFAIFAQHWLEGI